MGEIPDDLNGVYVRNGPNPQFEPQGRYHWFDGDGMVHAVHFADGRATYRNRWIRTDGFEREREAGAPLWRGIIEPFESNPPGEPEKDTANTDARLPQRAAAGALVPGGQALRARPGHARDARRRGLRRHAALRGLGAREGGRAHRRALLLRLRDEAAVHALRRGRAGRRRARLRRHRHAGAAAAARHGDHRALLDPDGPAARATTPRRRAPAASSSSSTARCRAASPSSRVTARRTTCAGSRPTRASSTTR